MSFNFSWPTFSPSFHEDAAKMLDAALNRGPKPKVIADDIRVEELGMGRIPPELEILEIGELSTDRFRGIFRLTYAGDAHLVLSTKVQANPLSKKPAPSSNAEDGTNSSFTQSPFQSSRTTSTGLFPSSPSSSSSSRGILFAAAPLIVPMELRLSQVKLRAIVVLVVSKTKGITLVFKNDPLESLEVSSTFDSVAVIQKYLQQEIEHQLREMFREDLPGIIHRLSQRWLSGDSEKRKNNANDDKNANLRESGVPKSVSDPQNLAHASDNRTGRTFSSPKNDATPRAKSKSRKAGLAAANSTPGHSPSTSPRNHPSSNFNKRAPSVNAASPRMRSARKSNQNLSGNPSTYTRPGHNPKAASTSAAKLNGELQNQTSSRGGFASFFSGGKKEADDDQTSSYGSTFDSMFNTSGFQEIENYDPTYGLRPDDLPIKRSGYSGLGKLAGLASGGLGDLISDSKEKSAISSQAKGKGKGKQQDTVKSNNSQKGSNSSVKHGLQDEDEIAQKGDISGSFGSSYSRRRNQNAISAEKERERTNSNASHRPHDPEMKVGLDAIQVPGGIDDRSGYPFSGQDEEEDEVEEEEEGEEEEEEEEEGEDSETTSEDGEIEGEDDVEDLDVLGHFDRSRLNPNRYEDDVEDDYTSQPPQQDENEPNIDYSKYGYPPPGAAFSDTSLGEPINFGSRGIGSQSLFASGSHRPGSTNRSYGISRPGSPKVTTSNRARSSHSSNSKPTHRRNDSNSNSFSGTHLNPNVEYETINAVGGGTITRPRVYHIASRIQAPEIQEDEMEEDNIEDDGSTRFGGDATLRAGSTSSYRGASTAKAMSRGSGSGNGETYGKKTGVLALDGRNDLRTVGDRSNSSFHLHTPVGSRRFQSFNSSDDVDDYDPSLGGSQEGVEEDDDPYGYKDNAYHHRGHSRHPTDESDESRPSSLATLDPEEMDPNSYEFKTQLYREKYGITYRAGYGSKSSAVDSNDNSNSDVNSNSFERTTNHSTAPTSAEYPRSSTPNPPSNASNSKVLSSHNNSPNFTNNSSSLNFQDLAERNQTLSPFTKNLECGFAVRSAPGSGHGYSNSVGGSNGRGSGGGPGSSPTRSHASLSFNQAHQFNRNPSLYPHQSSVSSHTSQTGKVPRRRTFQIGGGSGNSESSSSSLPSTPMRTTPSTTRRPSDSSKATSLDLERGSFSGSGGSGSGSGSAEGFVSPTRQRLGRERGRWESIRE